MIMKQKSLEYPKNTQILKMVDENIRNKMLLNKYLYCKAEIEYGIETYWLH